MAGVKGLLVYFGSVAARSYGCRMLSFSFQFEKKCVPIPGSGTTCLPVYDGRRMWSLSFQFERKNVLIPEIGTTCLPVYDGCRMWSKLLVKLQWKSYY